MHSAALILFGAIVGVAGTLTLLHRVGLAMRARKALKAGPQVESYVHR